MIQSRISLSRYLRDRQRNANDILPNKIIESMVFQRGQMTIIHDERETRSTIAISCSCDNAIIASSHGDHTIKLFCAYSYSFLGLLEGHPRTPWAVKFHPNLPHILATGCVGGQCKVWNIQTKTCIHEINLRKGIVSLDFHPNDYWLVIAAGDDIVKWDYSNNESRPEVLTSNATSFRTVKFTNKGIELILGVPSKTRFSVNDRMEYGVELVVRSFCKAPPDWTEMRLSPKSRTLTNCAVMYNDSGYDLSPCGNLLYAICFGIDDDERSSSSSARAAISPLAKRVSEVDLNQSSTSRIRVADNDDVSSPTTIRRLRVELARANRARSMDTTSSSGGRHQQNRHYFLMEYDLQKDCVLRSFVVNSPLVRGLTSLRISPSGVHVILGYGSRSPEYSSGSPSDLLSVAEFRRPVPDLIRVFSITSEGITRIGSVTTESEPDINVVAFHPLAQYGIIYGTRQGKLGGFGLFNIINSSSPLLDSS